MTKSNPDASTVGDPQAETWVDSINSLMPAEDIVSVNKKGDGSFNNRAAKSIFIIIASALLIGLLVWFSQSWITSKKVALQAKTGSKKTEEENLLSPEKTGRAEAPKIGADSGKPPPTPPGPPPVQSNDTVNGIRPIRGPDGKVMVNAQGRAMGIDANGNVIEVPAITAIGGETGDKKPLPGQAPSVSGNGSGGNPPPKPPSRYGGALFIDESTGAKVGGSTNTNANAPGTNAGVQAYIDMMKQLQGGTPGTPTASSTSNLPAKSAPVAFGTTGNEAPTNNSARSLSVGAQLVSSSTPTARAKRFADQNLVLPKGRQADCVLTSRIVDEVPGFTSCALTQNLYSDNGRVLLLERGSELTGEYGVSNQPGMSRLFVTWNRIKTPEGVEIDLSSPGADGLGTSGVPGHLDNRWPERIGAALLLSFIKDVAVAVINNQSKSTQQGGTSINISKDSAPGQNTQQAGFTIAEEVVKQTMKVRPTLTINEGDRISIYVARDLDFTSVYALRSTADNNIKAK
jgi:type IV secretion system protein VirB10